MVAALHIRAEKIAARFPPLLINARRIANNVWQGVHGRKQVGNGENFWQFRPYDVGDPADRIDWRQSARTDKLFVRMREWEAAQTACLWADMSGSMRYTSDKKWVTKADAAQILCLALASLLLRGGEKILWSDGRNYLPLHNKGGLERAAGMARGSDDRQMPPCPERRHTHMILASDFLMPVDALQLQMKSYKAQNLRGILLHIVDPLESSFELNGRIELQGSENEKPMLVSNAATMRDEYRQRFAEHQAQLRNMAQSAGWFYLRHITDHPMQQSLLHLYQYLKG